MWKIISAAIDVKDKSILDIGFGGGDLMIAAYEAGASNVFGLDSDLMKITRLDRIIHERNYNPTRIQAVQINANYLESSNWQLEDLIFCTSVLPYLPNPVSMLRWIRKHSETAILEIQGGGDGPGYDWFENYLDAMLWLKSTGGWKSVENLGYTTVEYRDKRRYIWKCED